MSGGMSGQMGVADSLLRTVGGRTVLLHMPAPAIASDMGERLGLATPAFQDVPLGPAVFRKVRPRIGTPERPKEAAYELLVSASAVLGVLGSLGFQTADLLFAQAAGVVVDGALLGIVSVTTDEAFGTVYLYRLGLRGAVKDFK